MSWWDLDFLKNNTLYTIGMGRIRSANPYAHVYVIEPMWRMFSPVPNMLGIPLGVLGNSKTGVQVQCSYNYGDSVLILYPENYLETGRTPLCYILGAAIPNLYVPEKVEDLVAGKVGDPTNLTVDYFTGFETVQKGLQISSILPSAVGHGSSDMLPGDFEAASKNVTLSIGDYLAGFDENDRSVFYDSLYYRWVENTVLKTTTTVAYKEDIAIINRAVLQTKKNQGHINDESARIIEQSGDDLYGSHTIVLSEDGKTPLARDYTGYDGTRQILSAQRLCIGKIPGMRSLVYHGPRIATPESSPKAQSDDFSEPVKQEKSDDYWEVKESAALLLDDWYPDSFVNPEDAVYPDSEPVYVEDSLMTEEIPLSKAYSHLEFQDDGSIKLIDAWGSYILMSGGNIEFHAMNNLFMVAARDMLSFAGANRTDYANCDISIQAYSGDLRLVGGTNLRLLGASEDKQGKVIIESKNTIKVLCSEYYNDATSVAFTLRNSDTQILGGKAFQVLVPDGQINMAANDIRLHGTTIAASSESCAFTLADNPHIAGSLTVYGGISCGPGTTYLEVITTQGREQARVFKQGPQDIINVGGGVRVAQDITTAGQLLAAGNVCGAGYTKLTAGTQDKIGPDRFRTQLLRATKVTWNKPQDLDYESVTDYTISIGDNTSDRFSFGEPSQNCQFTLGRKMPRTSANVVNRGYLDRNNNIQYIYPGQEFWEQNGIITIDSKSAGFKTMPNAQANN